MKPRPEGIAGGQALFLLALLAVSLMAGGRFDAGVKIYLAGEIAGHDVSADQDFLMEDQESTQRKREQVASAQPPVFDLSLESVRRVEKSVLDILQAVKAYPGDEVEQLRWQISETVNAEVRRETVLTWREPDFQKLVMEQVLPWVRQFADNGVVSDSRQLQSYARTGIIVRDLNMGIERLKFDLARISDLEALKSELDDALKRQFKQSLRTRKAVAQLVEPFLAPTLVYSREVTQARKNEIMDAVDPVYHHIKKGEIIVRQGERVDLEQQLKLQSLYNYRPPHFQLYQAGGVFLINLLLLAGLKLSTRHKSACAPKQKDLVFMAVVIFMLGSSAKFLAFLKGPLMQGSPALAAAPDILAYCLPLAGAAGALALFFPQHVCFFSNLILAFVCSRMFEGGIGLFSFYFLSAMFYSFLMKETETRAEVLKSVLPLLGGTFCTYAAISLMEFQGYGPAIAGMPFVLAGGLLSLLFVLAFSPIAELAFGYASRFRLMELMNLEQPLLRDLMVNAPGTYHHSLIVSNMVEASARAIGANPLLGKVAALYHDIGKLKSPHYFIENQFHRENKHDKLTPNMSALILTSHVKKGVELAKLHKLGPEICDLIQQHHGTTLIAFFYNKALEQAAGKDCVRESDYRYPGPKPQTKEAGLILLADAIEASSRTLVDPTPARIQGHIEKIVRKIFSEGELDESELTLRDLHLASETFHRILTGIFHHRIEYPRLQPQPAPEPRKQEAAKPEAAPRPEPQPAPPAAPLSPEPLAASLLGPAKTPA